MENDNNSLTEDLLVQILFSITCFLSLNVSGYNNTKMTFTRDKSCFGMYFKFVQIAVHV